MSDLSDLLTASQSLFWYEWPERFADNHSFVLSNLSESLTVAHLIWAKAKMSDERMSKFPALWFAGDSSYIFACKKRGTLSNFSNDFDSFPPFYARFIALRSFALFKDQLEQFSPVAHDKRATGAICSFSRSNCSLAFSLTKKTSESLKKPMPEFKTLGAIHLAFPFVLVKNS